VIRIQVKPKWIVLTIALILVSLQFTSPPHTNPAIDELQKLQGTTSVSREVPALFDRSCNDCHSNQTAWPWYSQLAPVSWLLTRDVNEGRQQVNFSEWGKYNQRQAARKLKALSFVIAMAKRCGST